MPYDLRKSVWDAWNACRLIQEFTANQTLTTYQADIVLRSAVERQFTILGEAFNRIDDADPLFRERFSEMGAAIGMRNRLSHGYDRVDDAIVWDVAKERVPSLMDRLMAWMKDQ